MATTSPLNVHASRSSTSLLNGGAPNSEYDFVVVGAGSAGCIIAGRLAKKMNVDVLLIEAGGNRIDDNVRRLHRYTDVAFDRENYGFLQWGYESTPQQLMGDLSATKRLFSLPSGKVLGGSHSINACAYVQAHTSDFDSIADELGDDSWRFGRLSEIRKHLESEFDMVEMGMNQEGAAQFVQTAENILGVPFNPSCLDGDILGISPSYWTAEHSEAGGLRRSSFDIFIAPGLQRKRDTGAKIHLMTHSVVDCLIFDPVEQLKVTGVRTVDIPSNRIVEIFAKKEVIISAGTYNSPKLLMRSGIGPRGHLNSLGIDTRVELKGVGENLRDHYGVATFWDLIDLSAARRFIFQEPLLNLFGPEKVGRPSYHLEISGTFGSLTSLNQESVGTVRLQSTNALDPPLIDPKVFSTSRDVERIIEGLKIILIPFYSSLVEQRLIAEGNFRLDQTDEELRKFVLSNIDTRHHPTGTCKIGMPEDEYAVVDAGFKVYKTTGLRVIDASIFPRTPAPNINASVMTIAMLGAEKIERDYALLS